MFSRLYPIVACAFILGSVHAFAGGAACCERPASRAGYLTAKPPGKGSPVTSAPAAKGEGNACPVSHSPAPSSSTTAQKPKSSSTLGALLGAFWVSRANPR